MSQQEQLKIGYDNSIQHLTNLTKSRSPLIWVTTHEEKRFIRDFYESVAEPLNREIWTWTAIRGLIRIQDEESNERCSGAFAETQNPTKALEAIAKYSLVPAKQGAFFILKDFHVAMGQPMPRMLRDMIPSLITGTKSLIFLSPHIAHGSGGQQRGMEPTLEKDIVVVNYELPTRVQIDQQIQGFITKIKSLKKGPTTSKLEYTKEEYHSLSSALQGLTSIEVDNALANSITHLKRLDERFLLLEKKQIIKKSDILEYIDQHPDLNDVGGLDEAKHYFEMYRDQFTPEAKEFGVEPLRGVILTGVPGTGKSLLAKAIAAVWKLPLLRLDVGKVMTGLVGGSEEKMRQVINQAEAIAPCVLWIDEIEKSLSGTGSSNFSDGGTMSRVFGTLLTAMEERFDGVVTIATANDIQALPPELIRRFNEVFFVDLPVAEERKEILDIHLRKRGRDTKALKIDLDQLVAKSHKYTGSELEKAVSEAIIRAFRDGRRAVKTEDLVIALANTKAIALVMGEKIDTIRTWARNRARYASSLAAAEAAPGNQKVTTKSGKTIDLKTELDDIDEISVPKKEHKSVDRLEGLLDD